MSDEELVKRCSEGELAAWNEFVLRYEKLVAKIVRMKLYKMRVRSYRTFAEDITQEIFIMIWTGNKLKQIRDSTCLDSWLVMVAINKTLNFCRRHFRQASETSSFSMIHSLLAELKINMTREK